jgi:pimeloyl-[acyl-carrier protein] methyl ester esterase
MKFIAILFAAVLLGGVAFAETASDRLTVSVRGNGPDVLLIPGLASSSAVWNVIALRLEKNHRVHLIQVAGFAGSPAAANAQGKVVQPTVDAIDAYIKANKLKAPYVIGHSLGGLMGLMLASEHPDDIGKLMTVDSLPFFSALFGATNAAAAEPQARMIRDGVLKESQDDYASYERGVFPSLVKSPEGRKLAIDAAVKSDKSVVARAMYEAATIDWRPNLGGIKAPVTVLYAWDSSEGIPQLMADGFIQSAFADLSNKKFVRIDNSLHYIMYDQPAALATQVDAFLK